MTRRLQLLSTVSLVSLVSVTAIAAATPSLKLMLLRRSDLPAGYTLLDESPLQKGEPGMPRLGHEYAVQGWRSGWVAIFTKLGTRPEGIVDDIIIRYRSPRDAHAALLATARDNAGDRSLTTLALGRRLGNESRAWVFKLPDERINQPSWWIAWRSGALYVDFHYAAPQRVLIKQAVALALKQQARIEKLS